MKAEEFYRLNKYGKRMENEYFIAMDKESLFRLMEAYARMKADENANSNLRIQEHKINFSKIIKHN